MKAEQIKEITEKATEQLVTALQQGHSETLTSYLKAIGRFHRYSLYNVMLIASQKPNELGANEKIVQRVLRHAKAHVTKDRYIKAFDPAVLAAMKRMETTLDAMKLCAPTVHQIN